MVINPANLTTDAQVARFEELLAADSGLVVDVILVERYAEALAALCASTPTDVTVAWLDGIAYQAAVMQNCGEPVLQIEQGSREARRGERVQIVTRAGSGLSSVRSLANRTFCRLDATDYYGWLVPSLMLRAGGVNPISGLGAVVDYERRSTLIEAVIGGDCDAAGITETDFTALRGAQRDELRVIETTPPFPYGILMYPINLPLGERIRLDNALLALEVDPAARDVLLPLFGQSGFARVSPNDLTPLSEFLNSTGLDFGQLGS
jgi:ABC-type phosphate/phosphonate transport system substrate-binding protein